MNRFYEGVNSLFVRAYDTFYVGGAAIVGDVAFYERLARETGGRVLELACGTGRIACHWGRHLRWDADDGPMQDRRASCFCGGPSDLNQSGHEPAELGSAFWFRLRARSLLPAPIDD